MRSQVAVMPLCRSRCTGTLLNLRQRFAPSVPLAPTDKLSWNPRHKNRYSGEQRRVSWAAALNMTAKSGARCPGHGHNRQAGPSARAERAGQCRILLWIFFGVVEKGVGYRQYPFHI